MLDEQAGQIFATIDDIAERVRKLGAATLRSVGQVAKLQRVLDNEADYVTPQDMLAELRDDNRQLVSHLKQTHDLCDEHGDVATASLLENWIDEAEAASHSVRGRAHPGHRRVAGRGDGAIQGPVTRRRAWRATISRMGRAPASGLAAIFLFALALPAAGSGSRVCRRSGCGPGRCSPAR